MSFYLIAISNPQHLQLILAASAPSQGLLETPQQHSQAEGLRCQQRQLLKRHRQLPSLKQVRIQKQSVMT